MKTVFRRNRDNTGPRKRRIKLIIFSAVFLIVCTLIVLVIKGFTSPAQGNITETPPAKVQQQLDPYSQPGSYRGKYITFTYPDHYKIESSKLTGSYLEVVDLHTTESTSKQVAIGVLRESLDNDSGVAFRRQHPETYHEVDSRIGVEFTNTAGTEDTFYIQHNDLVTSISVTAPEQDLNNDALYIASGLHWL